MDSPKVSVCIPTYNQPYLFKKALQSVFIQDYKDYEIIITDDSQDDSISALIDAFPTSEKLKYFKNCERRGSPANWNEAIDHAEGEYIKILHHDDWFSSKTSLSTFVKLLDNNIEADFAFSSSKAYGPDQTFRYLHSPTQKQLSRLGNNIAYLFPRNFIGCPSATIFRREINERFDTKLKWVVDLDFYIRLLNKNNNFIFCPEPLVCVTEDAPYQVTRECANNKKIEISEWIYLYKKINQNNMYNCDHVRFIYELFNKYNVKALGELVELGIEPPISRTIKCLLFLNKISSWMKSSINYTKRHR